MTGNLSETEMRMKALSRWEGEGGALAPTGDDSMDEPTLRLLARLGAALLEGWDELPAAWQDRIAARARTLGGSADRARARDNLDRLLARYRDGN